MSKDDVVIARKSPYPVDVTEGKTYFWCTCGRSQDQPFCDGAHQGTDFEPMMFIADKTDKVYLCGCKHSTRPPFCDGSHQKL
ncbi:CDGSH iron-sulfur domain-containing protein [Candidatus Venteria ishoeyi]|uniref:Iron-binding zinc finger CDGSH type n=1 Tax=Candidatus Venteria ishoeyi TaxID=1899563 RepID=A0A1H6FC80_9GAMM|nr:CDGSH iron-sulfur domain-containing protein [Candidatus Venteria ishoeyi]MDM8548062.1 CDGSH iron-sulfur domain-containing protein [Candidatus Venteria ishoeyi]SEH06615.1 Iron-binding zinc finger CDGSH type [Candidatus Venteria ishoeyi]